MNPMTSRMFALGAFLLGAAACSAASRPSAAGDSTPDPIFDAGTTDPADAQDVRDARVTDGASVSDAADAADDHHEAGPIEIVGPPVVLVDSGPVDPEPCSAEMTFAADADVPGLEGLAAVQTFALAGNELSIVWHVTGAPLLWRATRAAATSPFTGLTSDPAPAGLDPTGPFSLSDDGLRLVLTLAGGGLAEIERGDVGSAFAGPPSSAPFDAMRAALAISSEDARSFVQWSGGGVFLRAGQAQSWVTEDERTNGEWSLGRPLISSLFVASAPAVRRPTWMSADGTSVVVFDDVAQTSGFVKRPERATPFSTSLELGARASVQLAPSCARMYSLVASALRVASR